MQKVVAVAAVLAVSMSCSSTDRDATPPPTTDRSGPSLVVDWSGLVPRPTRVVDGEGEFVLGEGTAIVVDADAAEPAAGLLRGYLADVIGTENDATDGPVVRFTEDGVDHSLGDEGYELEVGPDGIEVRAGHASGFAWAVQTLRQGLPPEVHSGEVADGTTVRIPAVTVHDQPRLEWRGVMLDVARNFFDVEEVERLIDVAALYKLNRFHLHLTDDQGWRIQMSGYPELTEVGAATRVGGGPGGFYTQDQYRDLVKFAADRGVVVVPEIDVPGHTQAALASVAALNCDGVEPPPVATNAVVLTSSLCVGKPEVDAFIESVFGELAELTPGAYIHLGGDESAGTPTELYPGFVAKVAATVRSHGKIPIVWEEVGGALGADSIVQSWNKPEGARAAVDAGANLIMSPAPRTYFDMKYDPSSALGATWAGTIDTRTAYEWDPLTAIPGVSPQQVIGVEAALWTGIIGSDNHIDTPEEAQQLLLPRLLAPAELGWTGSKPDGWTDFSVRVAGQAPAWAALGLSHTADPAVPWCAPPC